MKSSKKSKLSIAPVRLYPQWHPSYSNFLKLCLMLDSASCLVYSEPHVMFESQEVCGVTVGRQSVACGSETMDLQITTDEFIDLIRNFWIKFQDGALMIFLGYGVGEYHLAIQYLRH